MGIVAYFVFVIGYVVQTPVWTSVKFALQNLIDFKCAEQQMLIRYSVYMVKHGRKEGNVFWRLKFFCKMVFAQFIYSFVYSIKVNQMSDGTLVETRC